MLFKSLSQPSSRSCQFSSASEDWNIEKIKPHSQPNLHDPNNILPSEKLKSKKSDISNILYDSEIKPSFRLDCSKYDNHFSDSKILINHFNQNYPTSDNFVKFLHLITKNLSTDKTSLFIYDTETEREEIKVLKTPEPLDSSTCITQLPNGQLFCFGKYPISGISLIIDINHEVQKLPFGTPCSYSSCIYLNGSVYCFGGYADNVNVLALSSRFDLYQKRWIKLSPMPQADSSCHSVIYNRNILISGYKSKNIWLYTVDIDSFSAISYDFADNAKKIMINLEKLYLIECSRCGCIYESEDEYNWRIITKSIINYYPDQVYCSYSKDSVYIGVFRRANGEYYKFSLDTKEMIKLNRKN